MMSAHEDLPRPAEELERLAEHYDTTDLSEEIARSEPSGPEPMQTVSLRLPEHTVRALKATARDRGVRWTTFARDVLERGTEHGAPTLTSVADEVPLSTKEVRDLLADLLQRTKRLEHLESRMDALWATRDEDRS